MWDGSARWEPRDQRQKGVRYVNDNAIHRNA